MIINSPDGVPWSEVRKLIESFYSDESVLTETDAWDIRVSEAISRIRRIVEDLPEKDRETQTLALWNDWQDKNPKPKNVDKISRRETKKGLKPANAKDLKEMYDFLVARKKKWENPTDETLRDEAAKTLGYMNEYPRFFKKKD